MIEERPLVSICCITYNHAKFIKECLDGFEKQQVDFSVEIIIHDDLSKDNTREFLLAYKESSKFQVKLLFPDYNRYSKGERIFPQTFKEAKGKYIAMCEGDDYWTDSLKLQKQVGFLEENEEYSGSGTNSLRFNNKLKEENKVLFNVSKNAETYTINDLYKARKFHTASFIFRNNILNFENFDKVFSGDRLLFLLVASYGLIYNMPEVTCVYRRNEGGVSGDVTSKQLINDYNIVKIIKAINPDLNLLEVEIFITYTLQVYSKKIYLKHYLISSIKYLVYKSFLQDNLRTLINDLKFIYSNRTKVILK